MPGILADPSSFAQWATVARDELAAAETLRSGRHWRQAFAHAGFAVECALKGNIMQVQRLHRWPARRERRELHIHDLSVLADYAGLAATLDAEVRSPTAIGVAWQAAKAWSVATRYDPMPFPESRAAAMVEAVGQRGLLEWLLTR